MSVATETTAFDRSTDAIVDLLTHEQAERIVAFQSPQSLQQRIAELAAKANEGELTPEETAEYEGYVRANSFIAVLQARTRRLLLQRT